MDSQVWKNSADATFKLPINSVHIWRIPLELSPEQLKHLKHSLSHDEVERAERFRFDKHRNHFIAARGHLRILLGKYLNKPASDINFIYNKYGKPSLEEPDVTSELFFNVSHSHEVALMGFCLSHELGIDVEWKGRNVTGKDIAKRFFSEHEVTELFSLEPSMRNDAFFNCWSRKEAYIKARGKGLAIPLNKFDVSLHPEKPAKLLGTAHDPGAEQHWKLEAVYPNDQYAAALVLANKEWQLDYWDGKDLIKKIIG